MDFGQLRGDGKLLGAAIGERADIGIGKIVRLQDGVAGGIYFSGGLRQIKAKQFSRVYQPVCMLFQLEDVAAIGAFTLEDGGGVMQAVG